MNLPNKLTLTRILLVPVFMIFVSLGQYITPSYNPRYYLIAGVVFAVASFTDFLDGHLARKWNMVTDFGKFADPLADKLLTTVAFIYMMRDGVCSPVVLCIILAREFAVSGLRMVAAGAKDGRVIAANMWGKAKTVSQMIAIIAVIAMQIVLELPEVGLNFINAATFEPIFFVVGEILIWISVVFTIISGIVYIIQNRQFISQT